MSAQWVNVWREVNAFLRYADARNTVFGGLCVGVWSFFFNSISGFESWPIWFLGLTIGISITLLILSFSFWPVLSPNAWRISWIQCGRTSEPEELRLIYFNDIARFETAEVYQRNVTTQKLSNYEADVLSQTWVNARVAAMKFSIFRIASRVIIITAVLVISWLAYQILRFQ